MDQFWSSLQDLEADPTNSGARSVVRQRGQAVADTFNYLSNQLSTVQKNQKDQVDVTAKQINSITYQLNSINQQIGAVEPNGYLPNDLYDQRDQLIDQLSSLVKIKVDYVSSGGNSSPQAEGKAVIKLVNDSGSELGVLVSATNNNKLTVNYDGQNQSVKTISVNGANYDFSTLNSSGKLKSLIESYGYEDNGKVTGTYPDMLNKLDDLAFTFATNFNKQHEAGMSPNEISAKQNQSIPFFADTNNTDITNRAGFASRIQLSQQIQDSLDNIATASGSDPANATLGDATNVKALADIINQKYDYGLNQQQSDFRNYYQNVIGGMGVQAQEATTLTTNSTNLQQAVDQKRQSTSSVSLDEEMTNMIQYQQAYNASAKMITIQDDILNTIINSIGATR
jgi:flagellar hook-associated protein 1 FlgK